MTPAKVTIDGSKQLRKRLREVGDKEIDQQLKETHKAAAEIVATAARPMVPVRSGKLKSTVRANASVRSGRVSMGRKTVPYAAPIHFGWATRPNRARGWRGGPIAPNPFLYDALDRRRESVTERYYQGFAKVAAQANGVKGS